MELLSILVFAAFVMSVLQPMLQARILAARRARQIAAIEAERGTRVITMIHRQETRSLFGFQMTRMIDLEDAQEIIPAIEATPPDVPIDLVLHTPGGLVLAAMQIARALAAHPARVTVHVPVYAMSGGTLLALAADEVRMATFSVLGPIDPQISGIPAASLVEVKAEKPIAEISDLTLVLANMGEKALRQVEAGALELIGDRLPPERAAHLVDMLAGGRWTHDYALTATQARELGMPVELGIPPSIQELIRLYPQPVTHAPAIEFLPTSPIRPPSAPGARGRTPG